MFFCDIIVFELLLLLIFSNILFAVTLFFCIFLTNVIRLFFLFPLQSARSANCDNVFEQKNIVATHSFKNAWKSLLVFFFNFIFCSADFSSKPLSFGVKLLHFVDFLGVFRFIKIKMD